jgi:hypothetical protein
VPVDQATEPRPSRERAITLAGDESKPLPLAAPSHPASAHPTWRGSTGRNDLSKRQLLLLRDMLHNPEALAPKPLEPPLPLPEETLEVNRAWRWGDAANSTVTLPSESSSVHKPSPLKKRQSRGLGMRGLRDMLKSFKRSQAEHSAPTSASSSAAPSEHFHSHTRLPASRPRSKTGGAESMRATIPRKASGTYGTTTTTASTSFPHKLSPRRPSLASIFRIGQRHKNTAPANAPVLNEQVQSMRTASSGSRQSGTSSEEDWDRMDSASDLDHAAEALGIAPEGTATVRIEAKRRSPYLPGRSSQEDSPSRTNNPMPALTASQSSIWGDAVNTSMSSRSHSRASRRLPDVDEHAEHDRSGKGPPPPLSRRVSGRSTAMARTGSLRSTHAHALNGTRARASNAFPDSQLAMTPENIRPLLENAKEVEARLVDCIGEVKTLLIGRV